MHISFFFSVGNCYLLTWKMAHILSNSKTFKFSPGNSYLFLLFCQTANFSCISFFFCFSVFCEFQYHFYKNIFDGNNLLHFGLEGVNIHTTEKIVFPFLPKICNTKLSIYATTLNFSQNVKKSKLKAWQFQSQRLSSFLAIKKTVNEWEVGGVGRGEMEVRFVLIIIFVRTLQFSMQIEFS